MRRTQNRYIFASESARKSRRFRGLKVLLILIPLLLAALWVGNLTVSRRVVLKDLRLTVLNLPPDLEEYSILHISDLRGARYGKAQKAVAAALGSTRYSCVVMTGDMLGEDGELEPLLELLALMPKETPKYLIPGAADPPAIESRAHGSLSVWADWAEQLQAAGVTVLDLPVLETRNKGRIWFVPENLYALDVDQMEGTYRRELENLNSRAASLTADDAARIRALEYELDRMEKLKEIRKEFLPTDIQIALTHVPLTEDYVRDMISWTGKEDYFSLRYTSVILAGYYNGGQWRLPFAGPVYVAEKGGWFPGDRGITGLEYLNGIPQHISPGMGSSPAYPHQPGRLFNSPEITRILLTRKAQ